MVSSWEKAASVVHLRVQISAPLRVPADARHSEKSSETTLREGTTRFHGIAHHGDYDPSGHRLSTGRRAKATQPRTILWLIFEDNTSNRARDAHRNAAVDAPGR
jgi:hypothetical protein